MYQLQSCYQFVRPEFLLRLQDFPSMVDLKQAVLIEAPFSRLESRDNGTFAHH